jgi:predicted nucleic acid-binding Zn ribbon protein
VLTSPTLARNVELERLQEAWEAATDGPIRQQTKVVAFRGRKLTVAVRSSPLLHELRGYRSEALLEELRRRVAPVEIEALVFRVEG